MELIASSEEELEWIFNHCISAKYIGYELTNFGTHVLVGYKITLNDKDYTFWALRYAGKIEERQFFHLNDIDRIQQIVGKWS
jgi:hypothetical protein